MSAPGARAPVYGVSILEGNEHNGFWVGEEYVDPSTGQEFASRSDAEQAVRWARLHGLRAALTSRPG